MWVQWEIYFLIIRFCSILLLLEKTVYVKWQYFSFLNCKIDLDQMSGDSPAR